MLGRRLRGPAALALTGKLSYTIWAKVIEDDAAGSMGHDREGQGVDFGTIALIVPGVAREPGGSSKLLDNAHFTEYEQS